jgi:hypothetical protein
MKKLTREEIIKEVNSKNISLFKNFYYEDPEFDNKYKIVWELNWGDGNELFVAINFPEENINVLLQGYYSSWDESSFNKVSLSVPYEFTETRYREATIQDIRDMKIDEVLEK